MKISQLLSVAALALLCVAPIAAQPPFGGGDRGRGDRGRGGFDPSSFLDRLDANGNGILEPEEQQGPAQFLIRRLQQVDSSIQDGQAIPLKKITKAFERMRGEREGGDDRRDDRGGSDRDQDRDRAASDEALMAELLVPGFGSDEEPDSILGFGANAEMLAVPVTEADRRQAAETMRRYDRDRDGFIAQQEVSSRLAGSPMDFDRNRDGKLSLEEMAVRYARRREGEEASKRDDKNDRGKRERSSTSDVVDQFNGRKSYRPSGSRRLPDGLPGYFADKDVNGDGQVTMAEFSNQWNDDELKQFFESDFNRDGVITPEEALRNVERGPAATGPVGLTAARSMPTSKPISPSASSSGTGKADNKYVSVAKKIVTRNDKNGDGTLTVSEWKEMLMSPAAADANRDGKITVDEYAWWMQSGQRR